MRPVSSEPNPNSRLSKSRCRASHHGVHPPPEGGALSCGTGSPPSTGPVPGQRRVPHSGCLSKSPARERGPLATQPRLAGGKKDRTDMAGVMREVRREWGQRLTAGRLGPPPPAPVGAGRSGREAGTGTPLWAGPGPGGGPAGRWGRPAAPARRPSGAPPPRRGPAGRCRSDRRR